jgi:hypothetical protein
VEQGEKLSKGNTKLIFIIFKYSVRTAKKTQLVSMITINWLTLFREIIAVYCENNMKRRHSRQSTELLSVQAGGAYSYHCAFMS